MYFRKRIYGLEFEYGVMNQDQRGVFYANEEQRIREVIMQPISESVFNPSNGRLWHSNGSCSYIDSGNHPEHATAECGSVRDVVMYAKAGDILMNRIFSRGIPSSGMIHLFKNNLASDIATQGYSTFGCHENYHVASNKLSMHSLVPFLITRQIFDGAGWWHQDLEAIYPVYALSQRALMMRKETCSSALSERGILHEKVVNDTGSNTRFHLILGDSNILEFAMYLKVGTVSLVLALIENEKIPYVPIIDSVGTIRCIALNGDPLKPCVGQTLAGNKSPLEIQSIYLEAARRELKHGSFDSEETEAELKHVALCWEQALNAIEHKDIEWMAGRIDHVTKKCLADQYIARRAITDVGEQFSFRKNIDIFYHNVTHTALHKRMNEKWADRRIVTDQEIERAVTEPPRHTRAAMRSQFIRQAIAFNLADQIHVDWPFCRSSDLKTITHLPDPFVYESADFNAFLLSFPALCNKTLDSSEA